MRRSVFLIISLFLLCLTLTSCDAFAIKGSGTIGTLEPELQLEEVDELEIASGLTALVSRGKDANLRITGDDNLLAELVIREHSHRIYIGFPDSAGGYRPTQPIYIEVTLPKLESIVSSAGSDIALDPDFEGVALDLEISGGGTLEASALTAKSVALDVSGGGDVSLRNLHLDEITLDLSGGGDAELTGQADTLEAHLSGGGTLDAIECETRVASLELDGGADASVHATEVLDVEASGGGTIVYRGAPDTIKKHLSGDAELTRE